MLESRFAILNKFFFHPLKEKLIIEKDWTTICALAGCCIVVTRQTQLSRWSRILTQVYIGISRL